MEPESLTAEFGGKIAFHGVIDTQDLLPRASAENLKRECERFVENHAVKATACDMRPAKGGKFYVLFGRIGCD